MTSGVIPNDVRSDPLVSGRRTNTDNTSCFPTHGVQVTITPRFQLPLLLLALFAVAAAPLAAQSPNTATMIVVVVDQTAPWSRTPGCRW